MSIRHIIVPMQPYCGRPLIIDNLIVPSDPIVEQPNLLIQTNNISISNMEEPEPRASFFDRTYILKVLLSNCHAEGLQVLYADSLVEAILAALETYMKYIVVSSMKISEHRTGFDLVNNDRYVVKHDMRNSMRFLNDLEIADYGSSSDEDSFLQRRNWVSNMPRQHVNNIESTNNTALMAIGARKRTALDANIGAAACDASIMKPKFIMRCKRISIKDVMFFMKEEKRYANSNMLFEAQLKYKL